MHHPSFVQCDLRTLLVVSLVGGRRKRFAVAIDGGAELSLSCTNTSSEDSITAHFRDVFIYIVIYISLTCLYTKTTSSSTSNSHCKGNRFKIANESLRHFQSCVSAVFSFSSME